MPPYRGALATTTEWIDLVQFTTLLGTAHKALDAAVADAYGWADYTPEMPDDEVLRRLLALNLERAAGTR